MKLILSPVAGSVLTERAIRGDVFYSWGQTVTKYTDYVTLSLKFHILIYRLLLCIIVKTFFCKVVIERVNNLYGTYDISVYENLNSFEKIH